MQIRPPQNIIKITEFWEDLIMMKKLAAMLLTGVMAVSLAACGGSTAPASSDSAAADEAVEEADATEGETVEETANDETKFRRLYRI